MSGAVGRGVRLGALCGAVAAVGSALLRLAPGGLGEPGRLLAVLALVSIVTAPLGIVVGAVVGLLVGLCARAGTGPLAVVAPAVVAVLWTVGLLVGGAVLDGGGVFGLVARVHTWLVASVVSAAWGGHRLDRWLRTSRPDATSLPAVGPRVAGPHGVDPPVSAGQHGAGRDQIVPGTGRWWTRTRPGLTERGGATGVRWGVTAGVGWVAATYFGGAALALLQDPTPADGLFADLAAAAFATMVLGLLVAAPVGAMLGGLVGLLLGGLGARGIRGLVLLGPVVAAAVWLLLVYQGGPSPDAFTGDWWEFVGVPLVFVCSCAAACGRGLDWWPAVPPGSLTARLDSRVAGAIGCLARILAARRARAH
ncbi:hypothetical protein GB931_15710 [Modestobacter sp. I12A-02628]|uniref:Uncharacterized protein n=1 Tax=Goekera deserti TaxID=2497753 RepID=A0A7K3WLL1_9ACTN|nr:hypothetical protein [Goekera deserti]MPQ99337.1 hypothetical protein [Goekera deserti]NDI50336.1 hypothetical protein [Goekera deserti]NEL56413.1 hypothetical protein [Goekera deserti]